MKPIYRLTLHKTYYNKGFFNVGVEAERFVRSDNGPVQVVLGDDARSLEGRVDRTANQNGTPRIHVGSALRNWFFENCHLDDEVCIVFESPDVLRIKLR